MLLAPDLATTTLFTAAEQVAFGSGFFPAAQRTTIKSEMTQAAGGTGQTYRQTSTDAPSVWDSLAMSLKGWFGTPYQDQYSVTAKQAESKELASLVEGNSTNTITGTLDWALAQSKKIGTLWDQIKKPTDQTREVVEGTRTDEAHYNDNQDRSADTFSKIGAVLDQVKGLFNLGFPQDGSQPVVTVGHEISATPTLAIGAGVIALIIIIAILVKK